MCKKAFFLFCVLLLFCSLPVCGDAPDHSAFMSWQSEGEGIFILKIHLSPGTVLCGLELDLYYNSDILFLNSCERGSSLSSLDFACSLHPNDGFVRLLFWGVENSAADDGAIVSISFSQRPDTFGNCDFSLSLPTENSAVFFKGNSILAKTLVLEDIRVYLEDTSGNYPSLPEDRPSESVSESMTQFEPDPPENATPESENPETETFSQHEESESRANIFHIMKALSFCLSGICIAMSACGVCLYFCRSDLFLKGHF